MESHFYPQGIDEIPAPELNDRGLHVFRGWDASAARQAQLLSGKYTDLSQLQDFLEEKDTYPDAAHMYELTKSGNEQFISHAIGYLGKQGLAIYRFEECSDAEADDFGDAIIADAGAHYPEVA